MKRIFDAYVLYDLNALILLNELQKLQKNVEINNLHMTTNVNITEPV